MPTARAIRFYLLGAAYWYLKQKLNSIYFSYYISISYPHLKGYPLLSLSHISIYTSNLVNVFLFMLFNVSLVVKDLSITLKSFIKKIIENASVEDTNKKLRRFRHKACIIKIKCPLLYNVSLSWIRDREFPKNPIIFFSTVRDSNWLYLGSVLRIF